MRFYETIFITKPDLDDEALAERVTWVEDILAKNGAQVINVEQWGKKRLAYQVNKHHYGLYVLMHYEGESRVVPELERNLRISEDILKHITVRLEGEQIEGARAAAAKAAAEAAEEAARREAEPPAPEEAPEAEVSEKLGEEVVSEATFEVSASDEGEELADTPQEE